MSAPSISVIKLTGELDVGGKAEFASALQLPAAATAILIDLSSVIYADSSALSELVRVQKEAQAKGIPIAFLIGNRQLARLIQYAGLAELFTIFEDRAAALTYLGSTQ